jgi:hypothetical protein
MSQLLPSYSRNSLNIRNEINRFSRTESETIFNEEKKIKTALKKTIIHLNHHCILLINEEFTMFYMLLES